MDGHGIFTDIAKTEVVLLRIQEKEATERQKIDALEKSVQEYVSPHCTEGLNVSTY